MIILFIGHNINHSIHFKIVVAFFDQSQILSNVYRSAIGTLHYFFIQSLSSQVYQKSTCFIFFEHTFFIASLNYFFSIKIFLTFVIFFFKIDFQFIKSSFKTIVNPAIHFLPQCNSFLITTFPFSKQFFVGLSDRRLFFSRFFIQSFSDSIFYLSFEYFGKFHIIVPYKMIAFFTHTLRRCAISI